MKIHNDGWVMVCGFVMLQGLDEGTYRVRVGKHYGYDTYTFYRGKRIVARHVASSVDAWIRDPYTEDLNYILLLDNSKS